MWLLYSYFLFKKYQIDKQCLETTHPHLDTVGKGPPCGCATANSHLFIIYLLNSLPVSDQNRPISTPKQLKNHTPWGST